MCDVLPDDRYLRQYISLLTGPVRLKPGRVQTHGVIRHEAQGTGDTPRHPALAPRVRCRSSACFLVHFTESVMARWAGVGGGPRSASTGCPPSHYSWLREGPLRPLGSSAVAPPPPRPLAMVVGASSAAGRHRFGPKTAYQKCSKSNVQRRQDRPSGHMKSAEDICKPRMRGGIFCSGQAEGNVLAHTDWGGDGHVLPLWLGVSPCWWRETSQHDASVGEAANVRRSGTLGPLQSAKERHHRGGGFRGQTSSLRKVAKLRGASSAAQGVVVQLGSCPQGGGGPCMRTPLCAACTGNLMCKSL